MCRGRGQAFYIHLCPSPCSSITPLISPSPPPQSHQNLQRFLSAAHQTGLFFYAGLCEAFSGISDRWGYISPFFRHYLFIFLKYVPQCFWAGASATRLGFFPSSSWLLPFILWAVQQGVAALPFHFPVSFWILSSAVQSETGRALAMCLGDNDAGLLPPCLPSLYPFSYPRLHFSDSNQACSSSSIINSIF